MSTVNRVPLGLLSLLDTQSQGVVPDELSRVVSPGFDLGALWFNSRGLEIVQNASAVPQTAPGQSNLGVTVPEGELWAVVHASARAYANEGVASSQSTDLTFFPNTSAGVNTVSLASGPTKSLFTGGIFSSSWNSDGSAPMYCRSGSRFGAYLNTQSAFLAGGSFIEISVMFYRLKI